MERKSNLRERILAVLASGVVVGGTSCGGTVQQGEHAAGGPGRAGASSSAGATDVSAGAGSGGSSVGGSGVGGSGVGGGRNCFNSGVGVCCDYDRCYAPDDVLAHFPNLTMTGAAGEAGAAGAAGSESGSCPIIKGFWTCGSVVAPPVEKNGSCCYVVNEGSCCGRPFLVGGEMRLPLLAIGKGWARGEFTFDIQSIGPDMRRALAEGWLEDARMEHASIAAFARFALQLLALGAPAELVQGAQNALADEIRHAQACFALASYYAGVPIGPGQLDVSGSLACLNLASVAALVATEGCIGETVAATLAAEQALDARDLPVKRILQGIAEDEARHAELAWQFVQWAIESGGQPVYDAVAAAFAAHLGRTASGSLSVAADRLRAHGRFGAVNRNKRAAWALQECVAPCAQFLLDREAVAAAQC